jgi:hypothetical protein
MNISLLYFEYSFTVLYTRFLEVMKQMPSQFFILNKRNLLCLFIHLSIGLLFIPTTQRLLGTSLVATVTQNQFVCIEKSRFNSWNT